MEKILVYLGSDHVIQHPSFGVREKILKLTTDREAAISQACEQDALPVMFRQMLLSVMMDGKVFVFKGF